MNGGSLKWMVHFCHKLLHVIRFIIRLQDSWVWGSAPDTYSQQRSELPVKLSAFGITKAQGHGEFKLHPGRADWEMVDHGRLCK